VSYERICTATPPTFIVLTATDTVVPPENSIRYYSALQKHGIPVELHIFPSGKHGFGFMNQYRSILDNTLSHWLLSIE